MSRLIHGQCDRLALTESWRRTIGTLFNRFECAERSGATGLESGLDRLELSSLGLLEALRRIEPADPDEVKRVLFCRAVARLPIFHDRVRRDGPKGPEFWNPLDEDLAVFLARGDSGSSIRRYRAESALPAEDVVQARVYDELDPEC